MESVVDVVAPLVADDQPTHPVQPRDGSVDDPAVPVQQPQARGLVDFCRRGRLREWDALPVPYQVRLRARGAVIRRVRDGLVIPAVAGTIEASIAARDQSI